MRNSSTDRGWQRAFDDPINLPDGRTLITLADAGHFIAGLPKREHDAPEWQAAIEALMLVVERGGPMMFARIGVMRALNRHQSPVSKLRERQPRSYRIIG